MKKTTLVLIAITLFFTNLYGENYNFKDGTFIQGDIFRDKGFEPNQWGVILTVKARQTRKVYVHHYPATEGALRPPLYYLSGISNPYGMPSCTPTRISFFHFSTFTLAGIQTEVEKMDMPKLKKAKALKAISIAMSGDVPKVMKNPDRQDVADWRKKYLTYLLRYSLKGKVIWGKDYLSLTSQEE